MESVDTKELKLQDQGQKQPAQTPDSCPCARRAKRMKCEVGVVNESWHTPDKGLVHMYTDIFLNWYFYPFKKHIFVHMNKTIRDAQTSMPDQ